MVFSVSPDLFNRDLETDANYQTQLCIFNIAALHIKQSASGSSVL